MKILLTAFVLLTYLASTSLGQQLTIESKSTQAPVLFGIAELTLTLRSAGFTVTQNKAAQPSKKTHLSVEVNDDARLPGLRKEGYQILVQDKVIRIIANDATGAMYGLLEVSEVLSVEKDPATIRNKLVNPHFTVRALKFNLPWSPYRTGAVMTQHEEVCKDLNFWTTFLDQMARNRFNVLSLWNVHPFSFMVKPKNFPLANNYSEKEMSDWKNFWTSLFKMAKDRGIETYIVNWNIAVSPEFAKAYHVLERNDTSSIVRQYTREVVTQVINEYPDLSGIGVTLADWMSNFSSGNSTLPTMTAKSREDWIADTFVEGIKQANRPVKFLHRSVLSSDPVEMRRVIDEASLKDTTLVEIKFNWSHGHSTPTLAITHDSHSGKIDKGYWDPLPSNFRIEWMIRNEDFFILRWGQPDFIKQHIAKNSDRFVNGYFVGSEGYIPAKDYAHLPSPHQSWKFAFQKQWLFYMMWGRLLYDPSTPDKVFEMAFDKRYGKGMGIPLLNASAHSTKMPLRLASFYASTWDYTLYSEGFLSPFAVNSENDDKVSAFISIDELINQSTLDPNYLSIKTYVQNLADNKNIAGKISPLQLADSLEADGNETLKTVKELRANKNPTLQCELDDLETWAFLSLYFGEKLKAGVALQTYRLTHNVNKKIEASKHLKSGLDYWKQIVRITESHYREVLYLDDDTSKRLLNADAHTFSWAKFLPQVERDLELADL